MTRMARAVTVIPSTINPITKMPKAAVCKRRVAGYARVSTASDEQFTSYEAQIDYYTKYIQQRPDSTSMSHFLQKGRAIIVYILKPHSICLIVYVRSNKWSVIRFYWNTCPDCSNTGHHITAAYRQIRASDKTCIA